MRGLYLRNKLFFKYLTSYLVILMIPIVIFTMYISRTLMNIVKDQAVKEDVQSLCQFEVGMDNVMIRLEAIRDSLIDLSAMDIPQNLENVLLSKELIRTLKTYTLSNAVIADIAYYSHGDSYIYTSHSSYQIERFFSGEYYYKDWNIQDFLSMVKNIKKRTVRPEEYLEVEGEGAKLITVMYPVENRGGKGILMFMLHAEKMFPKNRNAAFFIKDQDRRTILASYPGNFPRNIWDQIDWSQILIEYENPVIYHDHLISAVKSEVTGWDYVKATPIEEVNRSLRHVQKTFLLVETAIVLVGAVLIWLNMKANYSPIRSISKFLQKSGREKKEGMEGIKAAVEHLANENEELRIRSLGASRSQFLHLLLKGKVADEESFLRQLTELNMPGLNSKRFFVLVLTVRPEEAHKVSAEKMEQILSKKLSGYIKEEREQGKFAYMGGCADSEGQMDLNRKVMEIHQELCTLLETDVMIAISSIQEGYESIPRCYMEAMMAADYRFIKGYRCVIDSTMMVLNGEIGMVYPQKLFDQLNYQIKNGDADKIQQSLSEIIEYMKSLQLPLYYVKGLCYQLIDNISSIIVQINRELPQQKRARFSYATILADFETVDELVEAVSNISMNICQFIRNEKSEEDSKLLRQIKEYLDEQIYQQNFAIQTMAADLNMSLPALSSFFKNQYGETLSDYVTHCRMREAIRLMLEENCTIGDTVLKVGYLNTSSFIRKFKSIYGLTPGQYVKEHKGKGQEHDILI